MWVCCQYRAADFQYQYYAVSKGKMECEKACNKLLGVIKAIYIHIYVRYIPKYLVEVSDMP